MFCEKCGARISENAAFCEQCGAKVAAVPISEPETYSAPDEDMSVSNLSQAEEQIEPYVQPEYFEQEAHKPVNEYRPPADGGAHRRIETVVDIVKRIGSSPLFLIGVIAFSIQLLVTIVPTYSGFMGYIVSVLNYMGMFMNVDIPYEVHYAINMINSYGWGLKLLINIITNIPTMIVCIGLWVVFSAAKSKKYYGMKTGGLTTIKAVNIYHLVVTCIVCALVELSLVVTIIINANLYSSYREYYSGLLASIWITVGVAVLLAIVFTFVILYYAKIIKSINNVKRAIATDSADYKASVYVAVWLIIGVVFQILSIIVNPILSVVSIAYMICFSVAIFEYNRSIKRVKGKRERMMR